MSHYHPDIPVPSIEVEDRPAPQTPEHPNEFGSTPLLTPGSSGLDGFFPRTPGSGSSGYSMPSVFEEPLEVTPESPEPSRRFIRSGAPSPPNSLIEWHNARRAQWDQNMGDYEPNWHPSSPPNSPSPSAGAVPVNEAPQEEPASPFVPAPTSAPVETTDGDGMEPFMLPFPAIPMEDVQPAMPQQESDSPAVTTPALAPVPTPEEVRMVISIEALMLASPAIPMEDVQPAMPQATNGEGNGNANDVHADQAGNEQSREGAVASLLGIQIVDASDGRRLHRHQCSRGSRWLVHNPDCYCHSYSYRFHRRGYSV